MDRNELQQKLTQPFDSDQWKEVVETVFPGSQFYSQERMIDTSEEIVEQIADKGTVRLADGKNIALVELRLKPGSVHLHRNRVKLRSLVAKLIDQERAHGVIAVFEQGGGDYRLSFIAKEAVLEDGEFKVRETPAKRFTYLLGPGESCRTAAERLFSLSQKQELTLDDVTDAFSVEKLNKEFYRHIQKYFYELIGGKVDDRHDFTGCMTLPSTPIEQQENHKAYSEFAVRLLGRVVFCWFLKHKRCDQNRPLIPEELLSSKAVEEHAGYYHGILEKLFFQTLNKPMNERSKYAPEFAHLIPYLNGGLFDPHKDDFYEEGALGESKYVGTLHVPDDWFLQLFQTLEMYNFTIDENTALDAEVSIDPEILGRIFENLLAEINPETGDSARKATGSFYTPREIVDYMVEESLLQHLKTSLATTNTKTHEKEKGGAGSPSTPSESAPSPIREDSCKFVGNNDLEQHLRALFVDDDKPHNLDDKIRRAVVDAFRTIKVLDPACGSGAFPVGILQKMLCALRKVDPENDLWLDAQIAQIQSMKLSKPEENRRLDEIDHAFKTNEADYGRKLGIIQNSVYGVDIQPLAIEISKLRFFLTLVVDEKINEKEDNRGILPLPNLDFKFVCANTLIPAPEIENNSGELDLEYYPDFFDDFTALSEQYFYAGTPAEKRSIRTQLSDCVGKKIHGELDKVHALQGEDLFELHGLSKAKQNKIKDRRAKLVRNINLWQSYKNIFSGETVGFFDPKYMFPDAAGGFDIVIANPPYVRADSNAAMMRLREDILESGVYETLWEKWDLFVPFIERGYKLLKHKGTVSFIIPDAFCHAKYALKPQQWYLENAKIYRVDFLSQIKVFDAGVHNIILLLGKADGAENSPVRALHNYRFGETEFLATAPQSELNHRMFFPEDENVRLMGQCTPLRNIFYITKGMVVNAHERLAQGAFVMSDLVSDLETKLNTKKFVEGKHLGKWLPAENKWLEWGTARAPKLFSRPTFPEIYSADEKLIAQRSPGPDPKACYDNENCYFTESSVGMVPWCSLAGVRNRSLQKFARYKDEKKRVDLPFREELEEESKGFSVKYALGIINSTAAHAFLKSHRRSNIHLYPDDWKQLPIPTATQDQQAEIEERVEKILAQKKENPEADVSALEVEIDQLVYKLYDLTPEEIAIVEGKA
jgi:hypothetical protein